jgi:hypothetical protein
VETRVANLSKSKPTLTVLPDSNMPEKVQGAKLSTQLLKHSWKVQDKDDKFVESMFWMTIMGSVFWKTVFDPEAGEKLVSDDNEAGELTFNEDGSKKQNTISMGDTKTVIKCPFSILVPRGATKLENSPWVMDRIFLHVDQVVSQYDIKIDEVLKVNRELSAYERFLNELKSPFFSGFVGVGASSWGDSKTIKEHDICLIKEFWARPNKWYPRGIFAVVIGDKLVKFEEWPDELLSYPDDKILYPYVHMQEYRNPWGFYGYSSVSRLIPIQKHYNEYRTQLSTNGNLMANAKWHVFKGSGLSEDALTDEAGEVVETNPNLPRPEQLGVAPLPNYVIESGRQDILDFRDVGGEKESSQLPYQGITAGVALETASELSNLPLIPIVRNIEKALIKHARLELTYANKHFDVERILKVADDFGNMQIEKYKGEDLMNQYDIRIMVESSIADSKAANQQKLLDLWDRRIISDPDQFLMAFNAGRLDIAAAEKDPSRNVAIEQLEKIKNGEQPPVLPFDNHIVHFRILSKFIQSPEFRRMPQDRQQLCMITLQQHLSFLGQGAEQEEDENPAAVGTPFGSQVTEGQPPA